MNDDIVMMAHSNELAILIGGETEQIAQSCHFLCLGGRSHGAYSSRVVYLSVCLSAGFLVAR